MCKVLKVSRSTYYKYLNKKPSNRELENIKIEKEIINIHKTSKKRYGAVKINESLKTLGITISLKKTQRMMKKLVIKSIIIKKYRPTSSKKKIEEQENVLKRDLNAIKLQKPTKPLILHSDLGCQYTSSAFKKCIDNIKIITHSFSGKDYPYDNAWIESFHASLKKEEVHLVNYFDYDAAKLAIFEYIEDWYNRKSIHSSIGYLTPQKCEDLARTIA
ncbi:integrase core domain-containing protein [Haloimpatiens sp. FM7315]|uniref:integrase core domain-containing protein n=1 Tax=Haloimpatiens sp. FM7315 TaxID=3298609 RepID=UPI0035A33C00